MNKMRFLCDGILTDSIPLGHFPAIIHMDIIPTTVILTSVNEEEILVIGQEKRYLMLLGESELIVYLYNLIKEISLLVMKCQVTCSKRFKAFHKLPQI